MTQEEIKYHNQLWYYKTYNQLIDKCIQMESEGYSEDVYTEVHHILPKCMGGTNDRSNLVRMPIRYHIMAHVLLAYAYLSNTKLIFAANAMLMHKTKNPEIIRGFSTSLITRIRENAIKARVGYKYTQESKDKISISHLGNKNPMFGKKASIEIRKKMSESRKGEKNPNYGKKFSEEHKRKLSEARQKRIVSEDTKKKISNTLNTKGTYNSKKVLAPNGKTYISITKCAEDYGKCAHTIIKWINEHPEKGFKYVN